MNQMIKVFFMSSAVMMTVGSIEAMNTPNDYVRSMKSFYGSYRPYSNHMTSVRDGNRTFEVFTSNNLTSEERNNGISYANGDLVCIRSVYDNSNKLKGLIGAIDVQREKKGLFGTKKIVGKRLLFIEAHGNEANTSSTDNTSNDAEEVSTNTTEDTQQTNEVVAEDGTQTNETVAAEVGENTETPTNEVVAESNENTPPVDNIQTNVEDNENEVSINIQINESTENSDDDSSLEPLEISPTSAPQTFMRGTPILSRLLEDYTDDVERNTCCAGLWETIRNLFTRR